MSLNGWEERRLAQIVERLDEIEYRLGIKPRSEPSEPPKPLPLGLTANPNDPRIKRGAADETPVPQNDAYLVLSDAERAKGFLRPFRREYRHVGTRGPEHPLRELTEDERERHAQHGYVKFECYPESESPVTGRFWTQAQLDAVGKGCGATTTMHGAIAETYARDPGFYSATYCVGCRMHRPVGAHGEFVWEGTDERVGT